ncbi:calcium/sodium antiporter [Marinobacter persicus]|uniref:Cation:H+ antiporter n=1 Tax=Marinobacter persicus TaxID=930118 RepID=A0A2S6G1U1_9GAMM|nr:calcium/sodium antiporter [Marinobacter persicus]PPK49804.1 cation:H+ antiporter [Marinobacter persicus]PPK50825.1 cation:H+ antiporter [Marinobacter persicus]PPK55397.1 cation:H+ antiporter [Marinobacter persicus]
MLDFLFLVLGIALLTVGGEALIRGSLAAAKRLGVSPLLSGLVIVGFGTSAPELVVSVNAAIDGRPDIAIGNVVGSNIGNILLILGICALITPLTVKPLALRRDAVTVVAASVLFLVLVGGNALGRPDAAIFLVALVAYLVWAYWSERLHAAPSGELHKAEAEELSTVPKSVLWTVIAVVFGLLLLIAGSQVLLIGAIGIAAHFGVPEAVIGLTLVAVGTSLPELSISVIAAIRRHADVAVGNILGSNIFNLLGILGVSALLQPLPVHPRVLQFDQWVMLGASLLLLLFLYTGRRLSRSEGGVLLIGYGIYGWLSFAVFGG